MEKSTSQSTVSLSNVEDIPHHFKLPIFYNAKKMELDEHIITDLELVAAASSSSSSIEEEDGDKKEEVGLSMYSYIYNPKSVFGKKIVEKMPQYYTTDTKYIKDTQKLLRSYSPRATKKQEDDVIAAPPPDYESVMKLWDEIKNDTGFKEKYQYIDWKYWEHLNKSDSFLQAMSIYSLASPVLSLCVPFIILIIPFFIIKCKGLHLTFSEYIDVLKVVASSHAIGKLFTQFNSVKNDEKIYLLISALFYLFSIYQNVLTCIRFNQNMVKIHTYLDEIRRYIVHTEQTSTTFLEYSVKHTSYSEFNDKVREQVAHLSRFRGKLDTISPYTTLSLSKVMQYGYVLQCFYELYQDPVYNSAFLYSFGFNGFLEAIEGLQENIKAGKIQFGKVKKYSSKSESESESESKSKSKSKSECLSSNTNGVGEGGGLKDSYYTPLMNDSPSPISNTIRFNKNTIITGPNASGKTTVLKSSLINIILTQQMGCGFYSSASSMIPFKYIHCYLNIPDTSGRDSLFQAEARRCKNIIDSIQDHPKDRHFCVFDELYSGTNPDEAVASAGAFMVYLSKYNTVYCMLTTHFFELCKYLESNQRFENRHMSTIMNDDDSKGFKYTYLLEKGISLTKGGIKVLKDMNYPEEILAGACANVSK